MSTATLIGWALCLVMLVAMITAAAWWTHTAKRGNAATRARRKRAIFRAPIGPGAPFDVSGIGRGDSVSLFLDLDFGSEYAEMSLESSGIRLEFELIVGDRTLETTKLQLPRDRMPLNDKGKPELMESSWFGHGAKSQCVMRLSNFSAPAGTSVSVRGVATALPKNRIRSAWLWVG